MNSKSQDAALNGDEAGTPVMVDGQFERINSLLSAAGQSHVLRFWDELDAYQRDELADQVEKIDLGLVTQLYQKLQDSKETPLDPNSLAEPNGFALQDENPRFTRDEAIEKGEEQLRAGTTAVVIVAGGQGSRLGFDHPKGMFPVGPLSESSLFEILLTKVLAVGQRYGKKVPVYLMTSPATHKETVRYMDANENFGLDEDDLFIFCQGTMPAVDLENGQLFLAEKQSLFRSPDGHGGMLAALQRTGAFDHMNRRGIQNLFYMQVDNALVDVAAAEAIGYHALSDSEATTMVIRKTDPLEKVGNVAQIDGKTQIVEYSDLPDDVAQLRRDDGSLQLWAGNVAVHVWDVSFLQATATSDAGLPFHFAKKKIPFFDEQGELVKPEESNGVKFERFIFDLLPAAKNAIVVEVDRDEYFAPLKNPNSAPTDSPDTVRSAIIALHRRWLEKAGAQIDENVIVEIQPSFAATQKEVAAKVQAGTQFTEDTILK